MISQSERDREQYELEFKRRHDLINRDKLMFGQGRDEGRLIERIQLLSRILGDPVEELEQCSHDDLTQRAAECQRRARERGTPV